MTSLLLWFRRTRSKAINGRKKVRAALLWAAVLAMLLWAANAQTALQFTEHPTPTPNSRPNTITPGPDGNFWFTEQAANKIGKITPAGAVTEFSIPTPNSNPNLIASGPDGNLWFTELTANRGQIQSSGNPVVQGTPAPPNWQQVGFCLALEYCRLCGAGENAGQLTSFSTAVLNRKETECERQKL